MTLFINNDIVSQVLTMEDTIAALEQSYRDLVSGEAVCRPRIDIRIPTSDASRGYQFGSMEGGSTAGYFAVRMKYPGASHYLPMVHFESPQFTFF